MRTIWTAGLLIWASVAGAHAEAPIRLRCDGTAAGVRERTSFLASGRASTSYSSSRYRERVLFEMADGAARIHLPKSLVTTVNSGGDEGWWPVTDLKVTDDAISGRFRINIVNKPNFRIDRINGDIDMEGFQPFRGQCENNAGAERKF